MSTTWRVRRDALESADVKALTAALSDTNRFVRTEAVRRLGAHLDEPGVKEALVQRLLDRSSRVRDVVIEFLPQFGPSAQAPLEVLVTKETAQIVVRVAPAIAKIAEEQPHIGQRNLANALKKRSRSWWGMRPADRKLLRECAERIEDATLHLKDMPIAAGAPATQADLPRPASEPGTDSKSLPIPWWQAIFRRDR